MASRRPYDGKTKEEWLEDNKAELLEKRIVWKTTKSKFKDEYEKEYDSCEWMKFLEEKQLEDGTVRYTWELEEAVRHELMNVSTGHFHDVIVSPDPEVEEKPKKEKRGTFL